MKLKTRRCKIMKYVLELKMTFDVNEEVMEAEEFDMITAVKEGLIKLNIDHASMLTEDGEDIIEELAEDMDLNDIFQKVLVGKMGEA
jgi:hypothetical protein